MIILKYICSALSFTASVSSGMIKGNTKKQLGVMIFLIFFSNLFAGLGYFFNPAGLNGAASCALGCLISVINFYFRMKEKPIPKGIIAFYYVGFFVINIINRSTFVLTTIAILATFSFVINLSQKEGKYFRVWKIVNNLLWSTYDIVSKSYNQLFVLHIPIITFTLLSAYFYDVKKTPKKQ